MKNYLNFWFFGFNEVGSQLLPAIFIFLGTFFRRVLKLNFCPSVT